MWSENPIDISCGGVFFSTLTHRHVNARTRDSVCVRFVVKNLVFLCEGFQHHIVFALIQFVSVISGQTKRFRFVSKPAKWTENKTEIRIILIHANIEREQVNKWGRTQPPPPKPSHIYIDVCMCACVYVVRPSACMNAYVYVHLFD